MADPTIFELQIIDDQGVPNRVSEYVAYDGSTTTVDSLIGSWTQFGGLVDPCIDGKILGGRITIPLERDAAWKSAAVNGNNSNQVMTLNFGNDFNSYQTPLLLPSYKESILTAKRPNVGANPLLALVNYMIAGDTDLFPNSRDLHDLNRLIDAFLTTRKVKSNKAKTLVTG
jgi:hypothetical protein